MKTSVAPRETTEIIYFCLAVWNTPNYSRLIFGAPRAGLSKSVVLVTELHAEMYRSNQSLTKLRKNGFESCPCVGLRDRSCFCTVRWPGCWLVLHSAFLFSPDIPFCADGNPHNWDRSRRCDHTDYTPVCQACEGFGGIATGDENDQIKLTTCSVVANASSIDPKTLIKPLWTDKWVANE